MLRRLAKVRLTEPPSFIPPELTTLVDRALTGDGWLTRSSWTATGLRHGSSMARSVC
jgi:hypothetical protein